LPVSAAEAAAPSEPPAVAKLAKALQAHAAGITRTFNAHDISNTMYALAKLNLGGPGDLDPVFFQKARTNPNEASSFMVKLKFCRVVFCPEPAQEKWDLLPGRIKKITGREYVECRGNYKDSGEYIPMWDPKLVANEVPKTKDEPAIRRRLVYRKFNKCFDPKQLAERQVARRRTRSGQRSRSRRTRRPRRSGSATSARRSASRRRGGPRSRSPRWRGSRLRRRTRQRATSRRAR
jgi:hypothetical protein